MSCAGLQIVWSHCFVSVFSGCVVSVFRVVSFLLFLVVLFCFFSLFLFYFFFSVWFLRPSRWAEEVERWYPFLAPSEIHLIKGNKDKLYLTNVSR